MSDEYLSPNEAARQFSLKMAQYKRETERSSRIEELFPEGIGPSCSVEDAVACVLENSPQLPPEEVREFRLAIARRKQVARRDALVEQLFPGGIGPYEAEKVVARILEHFPRLDGKAIRQMNPGRLAAYLERVVQKEGAEGAAKTGDRGTPKAADSPVKKTRGRPSEPKDDANIAEEYREGLKAGTWKSQADYVRQRHLGKDASWLSKLLKRVDA